MTTGWGFTEAFRSAEPERVRRLERAMSLETIVDAMLKARPVVDVRELKDHSKLATRQRVEFCLRVQPDLLDAFFNGPRGYRAEFLRVGLEVAGDIDRWIVQRIAGTYREQLERIPGALKSLSGSQAKVWIRQSRLQHDALLGRTRPVPDINVAQWIARMDEAVTTPRGSRWLARAGVMASLGRAALDVKGGWIEGTDLVVDRYKADNRSMQLRTYGFT
jgi:hypothetical protein